MTPEATYRWRIEPAAQGERLDAYLASRLQAQHLSRSRIQALIAEGLVTVDGVVPRRAHRVKTGQTVMVRVPPPRSLSLTPEPIPLTILYQDEHLVVVDKPAGMAVHPAPGSLEGTLVHALLHHVSDLSGVGGRERPGIVHRLDKDTSGVLVVAKTDQAHLGLAAQFKAHSTSRRYLALVRGSPPALAGVWTSNLGRNPHHRIKMASLRRGGRRAVTHYRVLEALPGASLVAFTLETGRTHQMRVHCSEAGCPVLNDDVYGGHWKRGLPEDPAVARALAAARGQLLHAIELGFDHPVTRERMVFTAPLPPDFQRVLDRLRALVDPKHLEGEFT